MATVGIPIHLSNSQCVTPGFKRGSGLPLLPLSCPPKREWSAGKRRGFARPPGWGDLGIASPAPGRSLRAKRTGLRVPSRDAPSGVPSGCEPGRGCEEAPPGAPPRQPPHRPRRGFPAPATTGIALFSGLSCGSSRLMTLHETPLGGTRLAWSVNLVCESYIYEIVTNKDYCPGISIRQACRFRGFCPASRSASDCASYFGWPGAMLP